MRFFRGLFGFIVLVFTAKLAFSQGIVLNQYHAQPSGADVLVSWELASMSGVTEFRLLRKIANEASFTQVYQRAPGSSSSYSFLDQTIFKDNPKLIQYRLQVYRGHQLQEFDTYITHNPTSVQRTWGSIKAMFQ